jgi:tRNA threonylcarbamoyladenosine biosynthesis protein TsaB
MARDAMSVLVLDTAGPNPSVVVLVGDRLVEETLPAGGRASEDLLPAVARAFASAGEELAGCERIAVCAGPGSFTGVRVGLATAWGIGRAMGIPVEPVSTLEALAEAARHFGAPRVAAFLDAGRGELVGARFDLSQLRARDLGPPERLAAADAVRFAGGAPIATLPADLVEPAARTLPASLAASLALAVSRSPRETPGTLAAIYSRPSAAEEKHGSP